MADTPLYFGSGQLLVDEDGRLKVASEGGFDDTNIVDELENIADILGESPPTAKVYKTVTLTTDTNAYAAGDVLSDTIVINNFFAEVDGVADITSLTIFDKADQTPFEIRVYVLDSNVSLGTKNSAINISDSDAAHVQTVINVSAADAADLINSQFYTAHFEPRKVHAVSGTRNLYLTTAVGAVGTPTLAADSLVLSIGGE